MKYNITITITVFCLCSFIINGCRETDKKVETKITTVDSVNAFILRKGEVNKQVTFPAELSPMERAEIFPKVSGYLGTIKVDIGDRVKKGQVLAVLEAPEMSSNYSQANADVQTARSKYLGSLDTYYRILNASKVEGTIAAGELEKAKSQMMADSASMLSAKSKMTAFGQLKDYLMIRSPFSGTVTERNVDPGTLAGGSNQKPLFVIENTDLLRLRIPIPEAYITVVPKTATIQFTVDAQPDVIYKATLARKAGTLNLANRTETWEFIYPNRENELKSGMFANATLDVSRRQLSFLVPSSAVVTNLEKRFVIRVNNGKAEWISVRPGFNLADKIEVFGNLQQGDLLLARATDEIKDGSPVVVKIE